MLDKIKGFLEKAMNLVIEICEYNLKDIVGKISKLSTFLINKIRSTIELIISYSFGKPSSNEDYIKIGDSYISKQYSLRIIIVLCILIFALKEYMYPYLEGRLWRATLVVNSAKFHEFNGKARVLRKNGDLLYIGSLRNGRAEGLSEVYENGNIVYKGDMSNNMYNGNGRFYIDGNLYYEGEFVNNLFNGNGSLFYENGSLKFKGIFLDNKCIDGTEYYNSGNIKYTGLYVNDLYSGDGILYSDNVENSMLYKGSFNNGEYNGFGILYNDKTQNVLYKGDFISNKYEGFGTIYYDEGDKIKYKGQFKDGMYNGEGELLKEDGRAIFKGGFYNNRINYLDFLGKTLDEVHNGFGVETELYMLENSFLLYYESLKIGFQLNYANEDVNKPIVYNIKFFGDNGIDGIKNGITLADAKEKIGKEIYSEYSFTINNEDLLFYYLSSWTTGAGSNGYSVKYIIDDLYWNLFSDTNTGKVKYFEIGEI